MVGFGTDLAGAVVAKQSGDMPRVHGEIQLINGQLGAPDGTLVHLRQS